MDIYSSKERAIVALNSRKIKSGEIMVYQYYSKSGDLDSFIAIGIQEGSGPNCYQILSKRKNLIVCIESEKPQVTSLTNGQIHVYPVSGIYHMAYLEGTSLIDNEIPEDSVYYVEDFDSSYMYYLDRTTCKKLDDFYSHVYVTLSNPQAIWSDTVLPETEVTVWRDTTDITSQCTLSVIPKGCEAYITKGTIKSYSISGDTASVLVKASYKGSTYTNTWNIAKLKEGTPGADSESYQLLSNTTVVSPDTIDPVKISILYKHGSVSEYLTVEDLVRLGFTVTAKYSDDTTENITESLYDVKTGSDLSYFTLELKDQDQVLQSILSVSYIPDTAGLTSGQGIYKAIVFKSVAGSITPATPTGGSWSSPVPSESGWSAKMPEGGNPIWSSSRIFTSNSELPQESAWSTPSRITNTETLETKYSECTDATVVGTPTTRPEYWSKTVSGIPYFMATRTVSNGSLGQWQVFAVHGQDGSKSDYKKYIYAKSDINPGTPTGTYPDGWTESPSTGGTWWMSIATFSGATDELLSSWSDPVRLTGADGQDGLQGPYDLYQYAVNSSATIAPDDIGWSSEVLNTPLGMYLWRRSGRVIPPATYPESWGNPVRITGEKGEKGDDATGITIRLTNEVTSVAASYDGKVPDGYTFETTQVILYENITQMSLKDTSKVSSLNLSCSGVLASIDENGLVTVQSWVAPDGQDIATVTITAIVYGSSYSTVYTIQKIKAGSPGEDSTIYGILPGTSIIKRSNGVLDIEELEVSIKRTKGSACSNINPTELESEGILLYYSINSGPETPYTSAIHVGQDTQSITLVLKSSSNQNIILDRETVVVIESAVDVVVDLSNELSAVACDRDTKIPFSTTTYEESEVSIYYGNTPVLWDSQDLTYTVTWDGVTGESEVSQDKTVLILKPTGWDSGKYTQDTGTVVVEVNYSGYSKSVVYTIKKIFGGLDGESPVIYSLLPDTSTIKSGSDISGLGVKVRKNKGNEISILDYSGFSGNPENLTVKYIIGLKDGTVKTEKIYQEEIDLSTTGIDYIKLNLYSSSGEVLDIETVPVVYDGEKVILVTLSNEVDFLLCGADGTPYEQTESNPYPSTVATYLVGNTPTKTKFKIECSGCKVGYRNNKDTAATLVNIFNGRTATTSLLEEVYIELLSIEQDNATITVSAIDSSATSKEFTIGKIKEGTAGTAEKYSIIPSTTTISKKDSNTYFPTSIYALVTRSDGSGFIDCSSTSDGHISYIKQNMVIGTSYYIFYRKNSGTSSGTWLPYRIESGITCDFSESIDFVVSQGSTYTGGTSGIIDKETITVVLDGSDGKTPNWKDYIFCNSQERPETPVFRNSLTSAVVDQGNTWVDGPSGSTGTWWMCSATIDGETGKLITGSTWSTPVKVTGTDGDNGESQECQYLNSKNVDVAPSGEPGWSDTPSTPASGYYTWMRMRLTDGVTPGEWKYIRVTGERGATGTGINIKTALVYVGNDSTQAGTGESELSIIGSSVFNSDTATSYSGTLVQKGSTPVMPSNGDCYTYNGKLFVCTGKSGFISDWSVTNVKGEPGDSYMIYTAYCPSKTGKDEPDKSSAQAEWVSGMAWMGTATVNTKDFQVAPGYNDTVWKWIKFQGTDGPGQEFVFIRTNSTTTEPPQIQDLDACQEDEFVPGNIGPGASITTYGLWTDNPSGVEDSSGKRVEWTSFRKKSTGGEWGKFSKPAVYSVMVGIDNVKTYLTDGHASIKGSLFCHPSYHLDRNGFGWLGGTWTTSGDSLTDTNKNSVDFGGGESNILVNSGTYINKSLSWGDDGTVTFSGTLSGPSGTIGGWEINSDKLTKSTTYLVGGGTSPYGQVIQGNEVTETTSISPLSISIAKIYTNSLGTTTETTAITPGSITLSKISQLPGFDKEYGLYLIPGKGLFTSNKTSGVIWSGAINGSVTDSSIISESQNSINVDGSGFLASGTLQWNKNGELTLGDSSNKMKLSSSGINFKDKTYVTESGFSYKNLINDTYNITGIGYPSTGGSNLRAYETGYYMSTGIDGISLTSGITAYNTNVATKNINDVTRKVESNININFGKQLTASDIKLDDGSYEPINEGFLSMDINEIISSTSNISIEYRKAFRGKPRDVYGNGSVFEPGDLYLNTIKTDIYPGYFKSADSYGSITELTSTGLSCYNSTSKEILNLSRNCLTLSSSLELGESGSCYARLGNDEIRIRDGNGWGLLLKSDSDNNEIGLFAFGNDGSPNVDPRYVSPIVSLDTNNIDDFTPNDCMSATFHGSLCSHSDQRLKSNIAPLEDKGPLRPVSYDISGRHEIGFIAQEVQEKYPELVIDSGGENHYLGLNYPQLTAALQAQIITLSERLVQLESDIIELKKKL